MKREAGNSYKCGPGNTSSKISFVTAHNKHMKILLDEYMCKHNLKDRQVEALTGVPKSTVNRIRNNLVMPNMDILEQLAKGLNIRISDLYESDYK